MGQSEEANAGAELSVRSVTRSSGLPPNAKECSRLSVDSSSDAIIGEDLNGIIQRWNEGAEQLFGYTAEEALGHPITMLAVPDLPLETPGILERIRRGERVPAYDTKRRAKDGRVLALSLTISPIRNAARDIIGASEDRARHHGAEACGAASTGERSPLPHGNGRRFKLAVDQQRGRTHGGRAAWMGCVYGTSLRRSIRATAGPPPCIPRTRRKQSTPGTRRWPPRRCCLRAPGAASGWFYRLFSIRALPVLDEHGDIREWVGVHTDITEERELLSSERPSAADGGIAQPGRENPDDGT